MIVNRGAYVGKSPNMTRIMGCPEYRQSTVRRKIILENQVITLYGATNEEEIIKLRLFKIAMPFRDKEYNSDEGEQN